MSTSVVCTARTTYKKRQGQLVLTRHALRWSPSGSPPYEIDLVCTRLSTLSVSKEGGPKVMIKVGLSPPVGVEPPPPDEAYSFTFSAASSAISDREVFKRELSAVIAANREALERAAAGPAGQDAPTPAPTPTPRSVPPLSAPSTSSTTTTAAPSINALRRIVLDQDPALKALHYNLCITTKQLSEADFWEGRQDRLEAAAADEKQRKGRSGEMVDPKPETGDGGEVTVKITPNLIREIFEEYPAVLRAYHENVPEPLDDQQFWTRYFQSKLFNRNRTTNRAAVSTIKDDDIFDLYLGEEDDGLEPKHLEEHDIYRLLDLAATEEDQHEVDKQSDFTMRAGGQRASLPLMRRFNEHSERLLNQSLGKLEPSQKMDIDPGNAGARNYYSSILLDDLTTTSSDDRIMLTLQDPTSVPQAASATSTSAAAEMSVEEVEQVVRQTKETFEWWEPRIGEVELPSEEIEAAMDDMTSAIRTKVERAARDGHGTSGGFTDARLRELTALHASATEFLRQFWSAILPPNAAVGGPPIPPAERMKKAGRMAGHLVENLDKVKRQEETAPGGEEEAIRVKAALQPVRESIEAALRYYKDRAT